MLRGMPRLARHRESTAVENIIGVLSSATRPILGCAAHTDQVRHRLMGARASNRRSREWYRAVMSDDLPGSQFLELVMAAWAATGAMTIFRVPARWWALGLVAGGPLLAYLLYLSATVD